LIFKAFAIAGTMADGLHSHGRQGRTRPVSGRRQQQQRRGRQEELPGYAGEEVRKHNGHRVEGSNPAGASKQSLTPVLYCKN